MSFASDHARVRVPATSGNLGPGFDALGMAHGLWDEVEVRAVTGATRVSVEGEGAGELPEGEDHLVVRAMRLALAYLEAPQVGLEVHACNSIRHGRGLGSSAAAAVAGLLLARGLVGGSDATGAQALTDEEVLSLACELEGHPDNAAPAILGGAVVSWIDDTGAHAESLRVSPHLRPTLLVPDATLPTATARAALPASVPHEDAAFNAGRAALLTLALDRRADLLLAATEDRLHQRQRAASMPHSLELVDKLRAERLAAVISGAGPTVLVFGPVPAALRVTLRGWQVLDVGVAGPAHLVPDDEPRWTVRAERSTW